jgi:hypothetical protein
VDPPAGPRINSYFYRPRTFAATGSRGARVRRRRNRPGTLFRAAEGAGVPPSRRFTRPSRHRRLQPAHGRDDGDASDLGKAGRRCDRRVGKPQPPSVVRAAEHSRARFIDTAGLAAFHDAMAVERSVALVVLTRLAVTYDLMPIAAIRAIVELAHDKGALVYMDDAGGARVGPAAFEQPRMLELGVDIGATGLDKYGTKGPRLGLLAGRKDLVAKIRAKGFEFGMEARQMLYPAVVRTLEQYERSASCCAGKSKNTRDATKSHPDRRRRESLQRPRVRAQTHRRAGSNPPRSDRPICPPRSFRLRRKGRAAWRR